MLFESISMFISIPIPISISPLEEPFQGNLGFSRNRHRCWGPLSDISAAASALGQVAETMMRSELSRRVDCRASIMAEHRYRCMCICIYVSVAIYTYICVYMYMCVYVCVHMYIYA